MSKLRTLSSRILPKGQFARGVAVLIGGTAGAQAIVVLAAPLLTRLYRPEDFGLLAVFAGLLSVIAVIASLRYELAIPLPESDQEAAHVTVLSLLVVLSIASLSAVLVFFFGDAIASLLNTPTLVSFLWLLPLGILCVGIYQVFYYWAVRTKSFPVMARTKLMQALSSVGIQLVGYKFGIGALVLGQITGQTVGATDLAIAALRRPVFRQIEPNRLAEVARRYCRFPIYDTWFGLFNTASLQLPPILFAVLFSPVAAGLYVLALRVLVLPMTLVGGAMGNVFFANAAEAYRQGKLTPLVARVHEKLAHIAMPPTLVLVVAGPELFELVFGTPWRMAGEFARWMAPWIYIAFITAPLSTLFSVMEKQAQGALFQGVLLVTRIGAISAGAVIGDLHSAVILFSAASTIFWVGFLVWIIRASANSWSSLIRPTLDAFGWSLLLVSPLFLGFQFTANPYIWLAALLTCLVAIAVRYLKLFRSA